MTPGGLRKCRRKQRPTVVAVCLDLETEGFLYHKWGSPRRCRAGDWLVNDAGTTYTVDARAFAASYLPLGPGLFENQLFAWVERAKSDGVLPTARGGVGYRSGDVLVFRDEDRIDGEVLAAAEFERLYEPVPDPDTIAGDA